MRAPRFRCAFMAVLALLCSRPASAQALEADVRDVIDGYIVVRVTLDGEPVGSEDGLSWTILAGSAAISEDRFTKASLFRPQGTVTVVAQPEVVAAGAGASRRVAGSPVEIGIDPAILPPDEREFFVAGGGLCEANPNHALCFALTVDVRSVMNATVVPVSLGERRVRYLHGEYYAFDPTVGLMRITIHPELRSETRLFSLVDPQAPGDPFFPARAESDFHFTIDVLSAGVQVFNPEPMQFVAEETDWPVFDAMLAHQAPVTFHFADMPGVPCMTIENQAMYLYPTSELDVQVVDFDIDPGGQLRSEWEITNTSEVTANLSVFLVGNAPSNFSNRQIGPAGTPQGTIRVILLSQVEPSTLTQFVTLGAVSQAGPRLTGSRRVEFRFPEGVAPDIPALAPWGLSLLLLLLMLSGAAVLAASRRRARRGSG